MVTGYSPHNYGEEPQFRASLLADELVASVVKQIEILPKVASSRVCRHGIEETQPERFVDAKKPYQVGFERNEAPSNNGCNVRPELEPRRVAGP